MDLVRVVNIALQNVKLFLRDSLASVLRFSVMEHPARKDTFKRLLGYILPYKRIVLMGFLSMILMACCQLIPPLIIGNIIDDLQERMFERISRHLVLLLSLMAGEGVFGGLRNRLMHIAGEWFVLQIRKDAYEALQRLSLSYFEKNTTGDIMSRLSGDVESLENMLVHGTDDILVNLFRFFGIAGLLIYIDWRLAFAVAIPAPLIGVSVYYFGKWIRKRYREVRDELGELNTKLQDNISGIRVIQAFAMEPKEYDLFSEKSTRYAQKRVQLIKVWTFFYPAIEFMAGLGLIIVIAVGARLIQLGNMTPGQMVAAFAYVMQFYGPIRSLSRINEIIQRALASAERVFEIMDATPDVLDAENAESIEDMQGWIRFDQVYFQYASGGEVLSGVTFEACPGECVALVGRSGAGKTSIINLVPRFYDPVKGQVSIDGHDLRFLKKSSIRQNIALVLQDTFLFNATVRENIAYARPDASEEEILSVSKAARAHEFVTQMPQGYETQIGERGVKLSGGQKQRLAIARALLADPRILILDEATSSVDTESEWLIHEALETLIQGRTTLIIAHRLSTVQKADKILVLEEGIVVQEGRHKELLAVEGPYARMCQMQFALTEVG